MERRLFIAQSATIVAAVAMPSFLLACTSKKIDLSTVIGSRATVLRGIPLQGNDYFGYQTLKKGSFNDNAVNGNNAFVYCKNKEVIGFTIVSEDIKAIDLRKNELRTEFGNSIEQYVNEYGKSEYWKKDNTHIIVSQSGNKNIKLPQRFFYTEMRSSHFGLFAV